LEKVKLTIFLYPRHLRRIRDRSRRSKTLERNLNPDSGESGVVQERVNTVYQIAEDIQGIVLDDNLDDGKS
jgi:hypothetical protein